MQHPLASLAVFALLAATLHAQDPSTPGPPPAPPQQTPPASFCAQEPGERRVSVGLLPKNILCDQKNIWLFPIRAPHHRRWIPALAVISFTAVLVATDAHSAGYFHRTTSFQGFNSVFTGMSTGVGIGLAPVSLLLAGTIGKHPYTQKTALLAGEAMADSAILSTIVKDLGRRARPQDYPANARLTDSWFTNSGGVLKGIGSFPSTHTILAFSAATVIARRYSRHRWVPYVAYGLSGLVGFSRLTQSAHFPSDVFMGAALGYGIGRFAVLRN